MVAVYLKPTQGQQKRVCFGGKTVTFNQALEKNAADLRNSSITSGRKNAVTAKANVPVTATKSAYHIALYAHPGTYLCYVTTCATQALTSGNTVTVPTWNIEIRDPA
jgi:hypothetical protein